MRFTQIPVKTPEILGRLSRMVQTEVYLPFEDGKAPEKGFRIQMGKSVIYVRKEPIMPNNGERTLFVYPKYAKRIKYALTGGKSTFSGQKMEAI